MLRRLSLMPLAWPARRGRATALALAVLAPPPSDGAEAGAEDGADEGEATAGEEAAAPEPEPTWRFRDEERPVKVVVVAGSVGAWPQAPYAKHFERMCSRVEVKNISKTGYGALALKKHFRQQVLDNRYLNLANPDHEYWVVFQGGLNSIAMPEQTNRHIWGLTALARGRGIKVLGLTPTPWGENADKRWKGANALRYWKNTRIVVDFIAGRSEPAAALGKYVSMREDPKAPWDPAELPDVGIDLYDSPLRDRKAVPNDFAKVRRAIEQDDRWQREHASQSELGRRLSLDFEAFAVSLMPRWYLRANLRSFDDIHPNTQGHALIAEVACPRLPSSWGCDCSGEAS